jgi:hypothetical protein
MPYSPSIVLGGISGYAPVPADSMFSTGGVEGFGGGSNTGNSDKSVTDWFNSLSEKTRAQIVGLAMTITGSGYGLVQKEAAKKYLGFLIGTSGAAITFVATVLAPTPANAGEVQWGPNGPR